MEAGDCLVARNEVRLKALFARLTKETGRSITPLRADLSDKADLAKVERMLRDDQAITMLVNNAGIGSITPLPTTDVDKMETNGPVSRPRAAPSRSSSAIPRPRPDTGVVHAHRLE